MSEKICEYYNSNARKEEIRLDSPLGGIEFLSTLKLIKKYFPETGTVCDIGGGPGRYTIECLKMGYRVSMVDISEEVIKIAGQNLKISGLSPLSLSLGNATDLNIFGDDLFDAGLLLGPMYHLTEKAGRLRALGEFRRILKPGSVGIIAFINSWGIMKTALNDYPDFFKLPAFGNLLLNEISCSASETSRFTECHFTTPVIAQSELEQSGFSIISRAGVESFASGMSVQLAEIRKTNEHLYCSIAEQASEMSELPQYRDCTDHLHFVVRNNK